MSRFSIFTICTENYKDAIDFTLPSWLKINSVDKIYIYTDFNLEYNNDRVIILNRIEKTTDWLRAVGLKAVLLKDFLDNYNEEKFIFIDIDCYIVKDISSIFDEDFDIAATRMNNKKVANSGVWFCKNGESVKKFAAEWVNLQNKNKKNKSGIVKHKSSYSQKAFSEILHKEHKNKTYLKVLPVDEKKYNYEDDDKNRWVRNITTYKPYIIHYKGRRWRDVEIFKKALIEINKLKNE